MVPDTVCPAVGAVIDTTGDWLPEMVAVAVSVSVAPSLSVTVSVIV